MFCRVSSCVRVRALCALVLLFSATACSSGATTPKNGGDAAVDAGDLGDGSMLDAGDLGDASTVDAAVGDGGVADDAATPTDAGSDGSSVDDGGTGDAGVGGDGGVIQDGGAGDDAGSMGDASVVADGGTDAGSGSGDGGTIPTVPALIVTGPMGTPTEAGGSATFLVRLSIAPLGNVAVPVSVSDATEGALDHVSLVFTSQNYATEQTLTLTGVDDFLIDGVVNYQVVFGAVVSTDPAYAGIDAADVTLYTVDDDQPDYVITGPVGSLCDVMGSKSTFGVRLSSQPSSSVSIGVSSAMPSVAIASPSTLVFDGTSWSTPQNVTVTSTGASIATSANVTVVLAAPTTSDVWYASSNPPDIVAPICDAGAAALVVHALGGGALTTLNTHEAGGTAQFEVSLATMPSAPVTIALSTSLAGVVSLSTTMLTFDTSSWSTPQIITLTGIDDMMSSGPRPVDVLLDPASTDVPYDSLPVFPVHAVNHSAGNVALNKPATVSGCISDFVTGLCQTTGTPAAVVDGSEATSLRESFAAIGCTSCPVPTLSVDLGMVYSTPSIVAHCVLINAPGTGQFTIPLVRARATMTDTWTYLPVAVFNMTALPIPTIGSYRYVEILGGTHVNDSGFQCSELRVLGAID